MKARRLDLAAITLTLALCTAAPAIAPAQDGGGEEAQGPRIAWSTGPGEFDLGDEAKIDLAAGLLFADGDDTKMVMNGMGNVVSDREVGLVVPGAEDAHWFLVFEYHPVGHITDDDKEEIDADGLLQSISEGTEEANSYRREQGFGAIHVAGWLQPPNYDAATHNLTWAIRARDEDTSTPDLVNYNVRLLGREGFMSVTLVTDVESFKSDRQKIDPILAGVAYNPGRRYAEYTRGDKLAGYGLTALVAGGAGAAAAKLGLFAGLAKLFAKAGKAVVVFFAAVFAAVGRFFRSLFGKRTPDQSV